MSSFFRSLNPFSSKSGVYYPSYSVDETLNGKEIVDRTLSEVTSSWKLSEIDISSVFDFLIGHHYTMGYYCITSKGLLDFLIFPLISRKLLHEADNTNFLFQILAYSIALPLEVARFGTAVALTLIATPLVLLINLFQTCASQNESPSIAKP